ncbi:unnamed protein product, partial [Ectocarpus fasciculatus]
ASVRARSCRVSVAVANNHEGCPGGTPTRWVNERKVYHERNLPDATVLTEARRTRRRPELLGGFVSFLLCGGCSIFNWLAWHVD